MTDKEKIVVPNLIDNIRKLNDHDLQALVWISQGMLVSEGSKK